MTCKGKFQPTLPARGATREFLRKSAEISISTHAPRTGSDHTVGGGLMMVCGYFNPRSPHGERRMRRTLHNGAPRDFNPRSPHGERRRGGGRIPTLYAPFQPTLPARGATRRRGKPKPPTPFQPTLPARGATVGTCKPYPIPIISTHAPRTGSDLFVWELLSAQGISTHAPRTGSDDYRQD